jgi:predicted nicotinamide N-methyase
VTAVTGATGAALVAELRRRFVTAEEEVEVGGVVFPLIRPHNADDLISEADYVRDERLPYWADLWPSALVLARWMMERARPAGTVLELGCGLGLVTTASMRAGHAVFATDYYDDALLFARANAWRALGREPATRMVNWRELPDDLGTYDRVIASDVLYERPYAALVADAFARAIAPGGEGIMADPGRIAVDDFLAACESRGLPLSAREAIAYEAGPIRQTITIYRFQRASA